MSVIKSKPTHSNLFPAPKKPIASYRNPHSPDPNHHNYNRIQNFNQQLTSRLSWLKLQCDGAASNLGSAAGIVRKLANTAVGRKLDLDASLTIMSLESEAIIIRKQLQELSKRVAHFNRTKTKLTKEQMGIPNKK